MFLNYSDSHVALINKHMRLIQRKSDVYFSIFRRVQAGGQNISKIRSPSPSPKSVSASSTKSDVFSDNSDMLKPTTEQENVMKRLQVGKDAWEQLGLPRGCAKEDVNKAYRKLAILLHPDKTGVKGADDAFKLLCFARKNILKFDWYSEEIKKFVN